MGARQEVMYESYVTCLGTEVETLVHMVETGILPACAKDLATYISAKSLAGNREAVYNGIKNETGKLQELFDGKPHDLAEGLLEKGLYPYPTYEEILYSHHS